MLTSYIDRLNERAASGRFVPPRSIAELPRANRSFVYLGSASLRLEATPLEIVIDENNGLLSR